MRGHWAGCFLFIFSGCFDFDALLSACADGGGLCADKGSPKSDGGVNPYCPAQTAATLQTPDGSTAFCFNGFRWENPLPHGTDLSAVWGPSPDDVWAAGTAQMLMHWDGRSWRSHQGTLVQLPGERLGAVTSLLGSSRGVWLAGTGLRPHALDGGQWAPSGMPSDIVAMGVSPDTQRGPYAINQDSSVFELPSWKLNWGPQTQRPDSVRTLAVTDDGECAFSESFVQDQMNIARVRLCDGGTTWAFDAGEPGPVWAEHGQLLTSVSDRAGNVTTVWELLPAGLSTLRAAHSGDDVYFLGSTFIPALDAGFLVGTQSTVADTWGNRLTTTLGVHELRNVWGFADGGAWAVGNHGALMHQESSEWQWRQRGFANTLYALWLDADGAAFFAGQEGLVFAQPSHEVVALFQGVTLRSIHRVGIDEWLGIAEDGNVYERARGRVTTLFTQPEGNHELMDLLVTPDDAWAVGNDIVLRREAGGNWVVQVVPGDRKEHWKIARAGNRFLVAGSRGTVSVYTRGSGWTNFENGTDTTLYGIWTIDPSIPTAWVVGSGPSIFLFDGTVGTFTPFASPPGFGALFDVWGTNANDVWAVGDDGLAMHFDGSSWNAVETGTRSRLERVRSRQLPEGGQELLIVGEFGTVLSKRY